MKINKNCYYCPYKFKCFSDSNKGKGAAIKSAQKYVEGDYIIIQDADLEYDPNDYYNLISEIEKKSLK